MASVRIVDTSQCYSISQSKEETYITRETQELHIKDEMKILYRKNKPVACVINATGWLP
jgi:hypothetical protein